MAEGLGALTAQATSLPRESRGPLAGVPFAVKDNIDLAGLPTTAGTSFLDRNLPPQSASVVSRLVDAGALAVAKTNMHVLALGVTSNNATFGPVRNPADRDRSAGGSSGGSATAVAAGSVPFALGTDTGGSVRIPAAFCGIVGFRPSTSRYPTDGSSASHGPGTLSGSSLTPSATSSPLTM
ncbi:amidase family protein [Streptomyces collinus]|uniref:amidase family protein n=1 Tax=Streptomyces collinus TaxID=42684 RepID=UPI0038115F36